MQNGGYEAVQAFNKDEGKEKLASESPDLIILDIMMESTSAGFHFLYETLGSGQQPKPRAPILAVTSISQKTGFKFSPTTDEDFFPADDCLEKPVKSDELLEHIAFLLEGKKPGRT